MDFNYQNQRNEFRETRNLIPDGVSTLSKMPNKYVDGLYPIYIDRGDGCHIYSGDREWIDYPLGLGAIVLGHNMEDINRAVVTQMRNGTLFPCPNKLETQLAQKLSTLIPSCEMLRYVKTGSEACQAAVRIARAYTSKNIICCSGYHGWHDWYTISTPKNQGIPYILNKYIKRFEHGNIEEITKIIKRGKDIAAVMIEPYIYGETKKEYLIQLRNLCKSHNILLIFDEVVTGFRTLGYSAQKYFDVMPDMSCFGKAMGNGIPVGFVCGKKKYMEVLQGDCFVSSTFGAELIGISAALAVLRYMEDRGVIEHIWEMGKMLKDGFNNEAAGLGISAEVECQGLPCRTYFKFPSSVHKSLFWQYCIKNGVFFGHAQFISYCHGLNEIHKTLEVCRQALSFVKANWESPEKALEGIPAAEVFRMTALEKKE